MRVLGIFLKVCLFVLGIQFLKAADPAYDLKERISQYEKKIENATDIFDLYLLSSQTSQDLGPYLEFESILLDSPLPTPELLIPLKNKITQRSIQFIGEENHLILLTHLKNNKPIHTLFLSTPPFNDCEVPQRLKNTRLENLLFYTRELSQRYGDCCSMDQGLQCFGEYRSPTKGQQLLIQLIKDRGFNLIGQKAFTELLHQYRWQSYSPPSPKSSRCPCTLF